MIIGIEEVTEGVEGDFVYDIETEVGDFGAGVGNLIVKNTDSVFLKYTGPLINDPNIKLSDP